MLFRPLVGRSKGMVRDAVGNDLEFMAIHGKTPFNADVPFHFGSIESITDHIFQHLGLSGQSSIDHPLVVTEPICVPQHNRVCMTELLFECYGVPSLSYGIDALFSYWYHNRENLEYLHSASGVILRSGFKTSHVLPISNGKLCPNLWRINVGGHHSTTLLQQTLYLNYPHLINSLNYQISEQLKEKYCYFAEDYSKELKEWESVFKGISTGQSNAVLNSKISVIELPHYAQKLEIVSPPQGSEQVIRGSSSKDKKDSTREDRIMRMRQIVQKRKELQKKEKGDSSSKSSNSLEEEDLEEQERKQSKKRDREDRGDEDHLEEEIRAEPEKWLKRIQKQRLELQSRIEHKKKQSQSRLHGRQTAQSIARMKALTEVDAENELDDWNIYTQLTKDVITEGKEEEKLLKLNSLLFKYFPDRLKGSEISLKAHGNICNLIKPNLKFETEQDIEHMLLFSTVKCRVPEIVFSPYSIIGLYQMGILDTLKHSLSKMAQPDFSLFKNVFITGGNFSFPGIDKRFYRELREISPVDTPINIAVASNPALDSWRGAAHFSTSNYYKEAAFYKQEYHEYGTLYIQNKKHFAMSI
uniref:Actin-related protein 5 n=1 Tax=Arcella intermedia TaxID=1963864 RepID=A0A6B2L095_9EUKA